MKRIATSVFLIVSTGEILSLITGIELLHTICKPLIIASLIFYYLTAVSKEDRSRTLLVALFFSGAGDILLMLHDTDGSFFMMGLIAFLVSHVFYIFTYRQHQHDESENGLQGVQKVRLAFPIILTGTGLVYVLYPVLGNLKIPVMVYALVLVVMTLNALLRLGKTTSPSFWMVFVGALLFMASDSLLAINKFLTPLPNGHVWIMVTYISAQYLIVKGLIAHK
ncbi:MAG TPA: lysoplasmalogenase [Chryseolinea sp.]|nr:lysoplasmalogenase [Chryseolinea sp.]HPM29808.1 lysoplasmalogenase [Chryseolinea sp.]